MSRIPFGPNGCQFMVGGQPCAETQTLEIIKQFKRLYESKLQDIESDSGGGDYLQAKVNLQQEWIRDLTQQNELLVRAVEELEQEATDRVKMLEYKLRNTARSGSEVMQKYKDLNFSNNLDEAYENLRYLQSDVRNLIEFIRRVRDEGRWSIDGLQFYTVTCEELFGLCENQTVEAAEEKAQDQLGKSAAKMKELEGKLSALPSEVEMQQMASKMKEKEEELARVKRSMMDMRNALTIEVADKHDIILNLRRDVQQLEDQCRQANKQTQFKDDIIKELRKEIKQLKAQRSIDAEADNNDLLARLKKAEDENQALKQAIAEAKKELDKLFAQANGYVAERDDYKRKFNESSMALDRMRGEFSAEKDALGQTNQKHEDMIRALRRSNEENLQELERNRRDSEAMTQAQHETIQALQQALQEKGAGAVGADGVPSTASWQTTSDSTTMGSGAYGTSSVGVGPSGKLVGRDAGTQPSDSTAMGMGSRVEEGGIGGVDQAEIEQVLRRGSVGELQRLLQKLAEERDIERAKHSQEVANLKATIEEIDKGAGGGQLEISGLQTQVDLWRNTINVLEAAQEKAKIEISQQRLTIANLQEALVASKQQLHELQQKASNDIRKCAYHIHELRNVLSIMQNECCVYSEETKNLNKAIEHLRDSNLDLEVENFGYVQDVAVMETRLLKYQSTFKNNQECICELENELIQRRVENTHLKQHLCSLTCELTAMQRVINEAKELHKSFIELQATNEDQVRQNDVVRQELIRQTKLNELDQTRIEELQDMIVDKSEEADHFEQQLYNTQKKLDISLSHNNELTNEIAELLGNIQNYEQNCLANEERTDFCQQEIESCKLNLTELKDKLLMMSELLRKKVEQYNELETNYCVQLNTVACLEKQIAGSQLHHEDNVHSLKAIINDLSSKLAEAENNYRNLHEDFKATQAQIVEVTRNEAQLQQECTRCKQDCSQKLQEAEKEMLCMNECLTRLNMDKSSDNLQKKVAEEELEALKNDFVRIEEEFKELKEMNGKLKNQLCCMQRNLAASKEHVRTTEEQYNKCLVEIKSMQCGKQCLEAENKQYKKELAVLQRAHNELNRSYDQLLKSVINLETELFDSQTDRDKVCVESRNVIINVRAWLQDQAIINSQLTQKLKHDAIIIYKLHQKLATLQAWKCKCRMQEEGHRRGQNQVPCPETCTSVCSSQKDSGTTDDYYYEETDLTDEDPSQCYCIQRVETINQQLKKSNRYWESQMEDIEYMVTRDQ